MKITFDSNVWRKVASPENFPKEPSIESFRKIRDSIKMTKTTPLLCETVFTLEAIARNQRKEFFANYSPKLQVSGVDTSSEKIILNFEIGPNLSAHPGNTDYLDYHLKDAREMGFKIIKIPRIGGIVNLDIQKTDYFAHEDLGGYFDRAFAIGRQIEKRGAGIFHIKTIGEKYHSMWVKGIALAPDSEENSIASAIAEWADGDSIACHIAVGGDFFCTRDVSVRAGAKSVLSTDNIMWLKETYGFRTITPEELAKRI